MAKDKTTTAESGSNMGAHAFAKEKLLEIIERVESMEADKQAINDDIKETYAEAKGLGYDTGTLRIVVRRRKKDAAEQAEKDALLDLYLHALGMGPDPLA